MQPARIAELLEPFLPASSSRRLTNQDLLNISIYIDILQRWNARISLTAIRNEEEIVTRHFGESFFAAAHLCPARGSESSADGGACATVADVGSGAGFPGIPIKLWDRRIALTLIESNQKKGTFLREVVRALTLTEVNVLNMRAEGVAQKFDLVTLRAVERLSDVLPIAARLLAPSGRLALMISNSQVAKASAAVPLNWQRAIAVPQSASRVLLIGSRVHKR